MAVDRGAGRLGALGHASSQPVGTGRLLARSNVRGSPRVRHRNHPRRRSSQRRSPRAQDQLRERFTSCPRRLQRPRFSVDSVGMADSGESKSDPPLAQVSTQRREIRRDRPRRLVIQVDRFDAAIFDMDGVVTDSAKVHERCWKAVFDSFLGGRSDQNEEGLAPFTEDDYLRYVDGKPRYDGVASFLESRRISLYRGSPSDPPGQGSVCALGNLKDRAFEEAVAEGGVDAFASTVSFLRSLRSSAIKTALISSSRHARVLLATARITDLFDVIVDGVDADRLGLAGKPDPAIFLTAATRLGVSPGRAVVIEDAESGVEAGHRGGFGLVIGIDRSGHADALRRHGANAVVNDLGEVALRHGTGGPRP